MFKGIIRDNICLASQDNIDRILAIDAVRLSKHPEAYIRENRFSYDVAINSWLIMIKTYSNYGWLSLYNECLRQGLQKTVLDCLLAAQYVIDGNDLSECFAFRLHWNLFRDVQTTCGSVTFPTSGERGINQPLTVFLCLMRYLKRMTPLEADALEDKAIQDFIESQNRQKMRDRHDPSPIFVEMVKSELPTDLIRRRLRGFNNLKVSDIELTQGVGFDSKANLQSKLEAIARWCPQYFDNHLSNMYYEDVIKYQDLTDARHLTRMVSVPKSFKTGRTIAMENTFRQCVARRMFTICCALLPDGIDLHNQSINQEYARRGSISGEWATIDLSHASDDVTKTLVSLLYPDAYRRHLDNIAPTHTILPNGKILLLSSWATMGNSMTFVTETEVFWAICKAAIHFHNRHFEDGRDDVIAYGDDIIVPSYAADTVIAFLTYFGFQVNSDKSYWEGPFRESCGCEYWNGENISSVYYPRFPVTEGTKVGYDGHNAVYSTTISRLTQLQHRLWDISPDAARYVTEVLLHMQPKLTFSWMGKDGPDPWDYGETYSKVVTLPTYHCADVKVQFLYKYDHFVTIFQDSETLVSHDWSAESFENPRNRFYKFREEAVYPEYDRTNSLVNAYLYMQFLKHGPSYASDIDRLLGVSDPTPRIPVGIPSYVWKHTLS